MPPRLWLSPAAQSIAEDFAGDAEQAIRHLARRLLARAKAKGPPFFPDLLARHCGVREIIPKSIKQDGLLVRDGDEFSIYVNRRYPMRSGQWNAICAHELGHVILLRSGDGAHRRSAWTKEDEYLCDLAGRELLLPMRVFTSLVDRPNSSDEGFSIESLARLAEIFRAPPKMTAIRLVESGLWKGFMMHWKSRPKAPDRLALDSWFSSASDSALRPLRPGLRAAEIFGRNNRVDRAWRENTPTFGLEQLQAGRGSGWWFVRSGPFEEVGVRYVLSLVRLL